MIRRTAPPNLMVVFGASGDLAKRKLLPALFHLHQQQLLHEGFVVLGYARTRMTDEEFRQQIREALLEHLAEEQSAPFDEGLWGNFSKRLFYQTGGYDDHSSFEALAQRIAELDAKFPTKGNHIFYLATPPNVFESITTLLAEVGLANSPCGGWTRLIVEKPFGHDLESAQKLNDHLLKLFREEQVYRIDHYLGKETVQNILVFRFGNGIFEPIWNRNYVDHVQITVAESLGVGSRGGYYDKSGAIRDMVQNHMMQLVALTAMEPPVAYDAESVRNQKVNVLRSIRPIDPLEVNKWVVRAQYSRGMVGGREIPGYLETEGIPPDSTTETYVAWKLEIDNWRWNGVPFYIRTGKALPVKVTDINIMFRRPPLMYFNSRETRSQRVHNSLTLRIQPDESIILRFDAKRPGPQLDVEQVSMDFSYSRAFGDASISDAYERLLLDAMLGDSTLFIRRDETELAWDRVTNVLDGWAIQEELLRRRGKKLTLPQYPAGTWGPLEADDLLARDGHQWLESMLNEGR
ncbi:glucose-6-phosphate dehydrogenase [Caldilinea sp.]|jgi:glucose-6-phosphate 1-dehydrogenase|uniref:glucose-6-phosphate dehydrogenase n=1 Tax=Caldilinea sp. TaxID=2293560 RepID=UPI0021DEF18E|nr:glucose-6-phosphate dehydrogenase [Caldilinea sp.]GIV71266.1 MAG: glucose-6-phosphate 1-dehydrogenase [Caldilinea sp.]